MNLLLSDLPAEWIDIIQNPKPKNNLIKPDIFNGNPDFSPDEIRNMLSVLSPDMPYDDWVKIGMALHAEGYSLDIWDAWSAGGAKYKAGECPAKWNGFDGNGGVSLGTLVHMAKQAGWKPETRQTITKHVLLQKPSALIPWSDLSKLQRRKYLIKHWLDEGALSVVYGASNSGKTFFALDIACHISLGWKWCEHNTKGGSVIYIAGEGAGGISERLESFRLHHNIGNYGELYILRSALILSGEDADIDDFIDLLEDIPNKKLIIVDTLARNMGAGDENSTKDMNEFVRQCDKLREATRAHVMIIHHTGKDEGRGARGSSALKAAIDTEIAITQDNGLIKSEIIKQRDGETGAYKHFTLTAYEVAKDEDGEPVFSCVLSETHVEEKKERLKGQAKQAYEVLCNLMLDAGVDSIPKAGMTQKKVVRIDDFKGHFLKAGISSADKEADRIKAFGRQKDALKNNGYIAEWDGYVWLLDKSDK